MRMFGKFWVVAFFVMILIVPATGNSADTVEVLARGEIDTEAYLFANTNNTYMADVGVHLGVFDSATMHLNVQTGFAGLSALDEFAAVYGWYAALLDTEHIDIDLILDVAYLNLAGESFGNGTLGAEFNFDSKNNLEGLGAYLRPYLAITGNDDGTDFELGSCIGFYWSVHQMVQILAELDLAYVPNEPFDSTIPLRLGTNLQITNTIELFIEFSTNTKATMFGAMAGINLAFGT